MSTISIKRPLVLAISAAVAGMATHAFAQENNGLVLEEVIVTAEKRSESLQETPISISAFDAGMIDDLGVSDLSDLNGLAPNFTITPFPNSRSALVLFMRGVGNNENQITQDPAVGVYMDGVYIGRSAGLASDVADLERIEVLRGPQGTLYGRNTTGGAVNMITSKPRGEFGFQQTVSVGNYDMWKSVTKVETDKLGDAVAAKFTYLTGERGGWVENTGEGDDFSSEDKDAGRVAVRWDAAEKVTVDYAYDFSNIDGVQNYYQITQVFPDVYNQTLINNGVTDPATRAYVISQYQNAASDSRKSKGSWEEPADPSKTEISGHSLTVSVDTDFGTLKSITGYRELDEHIDQDYSGNSGLPTFHANSRVEHEQFSEELQLVGDAFENTLHYVTGIYYYKEEGKEKEFTAVDPSVYDGSLASMLPSGFGGATVVENRKIDMENSAVAVYGQATYDFTREFSATLGLRYTRDKREATKDFGYTGVDVTYDASFNPTFIEPITLSDSETFSKFNPSLTLDYRFNDNVNVYAKAVTAYKSGGFNLRSGRDNFTPPFDEENIVSYEVGVKSELLDRRVRLNAAAFQSKYKDMQLQQIPVAQRVSQTVVVNAGEASIDGFELDVTARVAEGLTAMLGYGYTHAAFDEVIDTIPIKYNLQSNDYGPNPTYNRDVSGETVMPYAPMHTYNATLDYVFPSIGVGTLRGLLNYSWVDEQYGTGRNDDLEGFKLDDRGLLNARLALEEIGVGSDGSLSTSLWVRNWENKEYYAHAVSFGYLRTATYGEPRTYGIDITYNYK